MRTLLLAAFLAALSAVAPAGAQSRATLQDLAWIAGHWRGELNGAPMDEVWTVPSGDCMVGMFRMVRDGKVRFYEIIVIEQEAEGPVLRLKHFNRALIGWEEKEAGQPYPLISFKPDEAVFQSTNPDKPTKLTYRKAGAEALHIRLDTFRDGKPVSQDFYFKK